MSATDLIGRHAETTAVAELLDSSVAEVTALVIEGEPGIGKTTLWRTALEQARERGVRILAARASAAESVLAYATLADLLADVDRLLWADLPRPQRHALAAALLEDLDDGVAATDPRAVGAALLAVLARLAGDSPVLVAIDDVQWLDASSAAAIAFALRRLSGRLGVIATVRADAAISATDWLQLSRPAATRHIHLQPLGIAEVHDLLTRQLGHAVNRPGLLRIQQLSGGNPFYAVELARELDQYESSAHLVLPESLAELMRGRIGRLDGDADGALLSIACLADLTISRVADALDMTPADLVDLLGVAEQRGVLTIDGQRLAFTHPLVAHAVHADASPAQRRSTHRRLARVVTAPELRARHLALADPVGEPATLAALDAAAAIATGRGAPAAAADMLDLAINRGGATHERRMLLAQCLFDSGDPRRARTVLEASIEDGRTGRERAEARQRLALVRLYDDSFADATELLECALTDEWDDAELRVGLHATLAFTQLNSGRPDVARATAERAVTSARNLDSTDLLSRALGMRAITRFFTGEDLEPADLQPVVTPERVGERVPVAFRPDVQSALLRGWTGDYATARDELSRIAGQSAARGEEGELMFLTFSVAPFDIWRAELGLAADAAEAAADRASQLGTAAAHFLASSLGAAVAAYQGRVDDARQHADAALKAGAESGYLLMMGHVVALQGFLDVSQGDHRAALDHLEPLLPMVLGTPRCSEINVAGFLPDAVEALVCRGRLDDAEPLVAALEEDGERLGRPWMLAVGARCRAILTAARGDAETAAAHAHRALHHHDDLDMPFERARTLLVLGRLERRLRRWRPATVSLGEALRLFESAATPLWAAHARAELDRGVPGRTKTTGLTPAERRVAELAADGMSTRDIAATLFVSRKTVDTNLSRAYAKMGVHSRIQLVHAMRKAAADHSGDG